MKRMVGILVHGNNHYVLSGPRPSQAEALQLARNWSLLQIGEVKSQKFGQWEIRNKEFRENLEWAAIVPGDREISLGVAELWAKSFTVVVANGCNLRPSVILQGGCEHVSMQYRDENEIKLLDLGSGDSRSSGVGGVE